MHGARQLILWKRNEKTGKIGKFCENFPIFPVFKYPCMKVISQCLVPASISRPSCGAVLLITNGLLRNWPILSILDVLKSFCRSLMGLMKKRAHNPICRYAAIRQDESGSIYFRPQYILGMWLIFGIFLCIFQRNHPAIKLAPSEFFLR